MTFYFDATQALRLSYLFEMAARRAEGTIVEQTEDSFAYEAKGAKVN